MTAFVLTVAFISNLNFVDPFTNTGARVKVGHRPFLRGVRLKYHNTEIGSLEWGQIGSDEPFNGHINTAEQRITTTIR